jgi:predicted transcriptional regulator
MEAANTEQLLTFFKALGDANRLKIVGVLAQEPRSVEEIAALLDLEPSTISHHLRRLSKAGLVEAKADGYYSIYSLRVDAIHDMSRSLLAEDTLPRFADELDLDAFDKKVLATFSDEDGRFTAFPAQEKKYKVLVRHVLRDFDVGVRYSEKEVNMKLMRYNKDTARLRRSLIDYGYMARERGGTAYWREA